MNLFAEMKTLMNEVAEVYRQHLAHIGVNAAEAVIIRALHERDDQPAGKLARAAAYAPTSFTQVLDRMESGGLVCRRAGTPDRRSVTICLTASERVVKATVSALEAADTEAQALVSAWVERHGLAPVGIEVVR